MATAVPGPPNAEAMRWTACCAPLVTTISSGSVGTPVAGHVGGEAGPQPGQAERVVAHLAEQAGHILAQGQGDRVGDPRAGRQRPDGQADGLLHGRGAAR